MSRISTTSLFKVTEIQEFDIYPDGERAILSANTGGNWELATLDLKTGKLTKFLTAKQSLTYPRYSSSGDRIVFQLDFEGDEDHDIVTIGSAGERTNRITTFSILRSLLTADTLPFYPTDRMTSRTSIRLGREAAISRGSRSRCCQ